MVRKLLLADDSVAIHKVIKLTFLGEDIEVTAVDSGLAALQSAAQEVPDIFIIDIFMPGLTGYDVCAQLRAQPATADTPVILLVGAFESFDSKQAQEAGATAHLKKPIEPQSLLRLVKELLGEQQSTSTVEANDEIYQATHRPSFENTAQVNHGILLQPLELIDAPSDNSFLRGSLLAERQNIDSIDSNMTELPPSSYDSGFEILSLDDRPPEHWSAEAPRAAVTTSPLHEENMTPTQAGQMAKSSGLHTRSQIHPGLEESAPVPIFNAPEPPAVDFFGERLPAPTIFVGETSHEIETEPPVEAKTNGSAIQSSDDPKDAAMSEPATLQNATASATESLAKVGISSANAAALVSPELIDEISARVVARLRDGLREEVRRAIEDALNDYLRDL